MIFSICSAVRASPSLKIEVRTSMKKMESLQASPFIVLTFCQQHPPFRRETS